MSLLLRGECGLLFTNEKTEDVLEYFQNLAEPDYARLPVINFIQKIIFALFVLSEIYLLKYSRKLPSSEIVL